jgi:ribose-phosphate pyrophosphokinase
MKTSFILTSTTEYLLASLKRKANNFEFVFSGKNKEGKRFFPDGEVYIRIAEVNNLRDRRVIVLHSGAPNPNEGLVELEMILQILKDHKIKPELFFTYFPYGKQDRAFENGEANIAESLIKKLIDYYRVKKIYIIDPHFAKMEWIKKYPLTSIATASFLIEKAKKDLGQNIMFLSPDKGGKRRTGISGIKKKRIDSFRVESFSPKINVQGKTIGVVDDLLETGGTLLKFYEVMRKSGADKIIALITHGVLDSGIKKIKKKFLKTYLTNTINKKEANVDITDLIVDNIIKK